MINAYIFSTELGHAALVWDAENDELSRVFLPYDSLDRLRSDIQEAFASINLAKVDIPNWIETLSFDMKAYYRGEMEISEITLAAPLNLKRFTEFQRKVYETLKTTKSNEILSYKALAEMCGKPKAARAVGSCMARNPFPLLIPCHRVVTTSGKLGNFTADTGVKLKEKMQLLDQRGKTVQKIL